MNVLFIMADQLRWDHLGSAGHPYLRTPNLDALAARGVRFSHAFVNSGVCGPSRMSYYTGRYPSSHGATWNRVPLSLAEWTLGDYLRGAGRTLALAGKTHVVPDREAMARLHIDGASELGHLVSRGHFVEIDRYDGHHEPRGESGYPAFLRAQGYDSEDPWHDYVIATVGPDGQVLDGWSMRNVAYPSRVSEAHSETAFMTDQALAFIDRQGDAPWVLHLSYVKPHWPYVAPAPYHARYRPDQCLPVVRSPVEREDPHPVFGAYQQHEESRSFQLDDCIRTVRPVYQGLVEQLDAHLGRLFAHLDKTGQARRTLIVFCADHGDFLGDHWLGEKELFYDTVQRVPMIVVDPRPPADPSRGRVDDRFVEAVDVLPTILDALGLPIPGHRIEGHSLLPLLHDQPVAWRDAVYSELDYGFREARRLLGRSPQACRGWSLRDARWRYVHWLGLREQLFDLHADPEQFHDLGASAAHASIRQQFRDRLLARMLAGKRRTTASDDYVQTHTATHRAHGIHFGRW